uniref:MFS domain-containing protein n=1 Tax=Ascaris lumbricoides TaxID=6252 RepID=A0A0M3HWP5_ASCLU
MAHKFRLIILLLASACLSMMMANILTLNFCILCMTENQFAYEDQSIKFGYDVFQSIQSGESFTDGVERDAIAELSPLKFKFPSMFDFTPGFNKTSFKLAENHPELFLRIIKMVAMELGKNGTEKVGEQVDLLNVDIEQIRNGFNFTAIDPKLMARAKEHIIGVAEATNELMDAQGKKVSKWMNTKPEDLELRNVTWDGVVSLRRRVIVKRADHEYSAQERSILFAAIAIGALIAIFPISAGIHRYGCRNSFTTVGVMAATATAFCPLAASLGIVPLIFMRMLQGVGYAACMPVIGSVTSTWASLGENGLFSGALTSFIQLGPVIAMPLSGILCVSPAGWPSVFYAHGGITFMLITLWWTLYRDSPSGSKHVSAKELAVIQDGKLCSSKENANNDRLPLRRIYTSLSAWAVWIAAIGNMCSIQMVIVFAPTYLNQVLGFQLINAGFAAALPTLLQFVVKIIAGMSSDKIAFLGETAKVRVFNSIAFIGMGSFLVALALLPDSLPLVALACLIGSATILGFNTGGFFKSCTLIGRQYSHFINANVQMIMCVAMLLVPFVVFSMTPNGSASEWRRVFFLHAALLFITNAVFCVIGQGEAADFTHSSSQDGALHEHLTPINRATACSL